MFVTMMMNDQAATISIIYSATLPAAGATYARVMQVGHAGQSAQRRLTASITATAVSPMFGLLDHPPAGKQPDNDALRAKTPRLADVSQRCCAALPPSIQSPSSSSLVCCCSS